MHPGDVMTSKQRAQETEEHQRFPTRSVSDPAVTKAFAIEAARMLADDRCEDVLCLDVRSLSQVSDFIIVASGTSDRQMRSAGDDVAKLAQTSGYGVMRRSQDERATWIVLDCVDVVVHIFEPNTRAHYDLEMLWGDATHIDWRRPGGKDGASQRGYAGARGGVAADNAAESDEPDFGTDEDYSTGEDEMDGDDAGESGAETDDATAGMTDEELEIATRPDAPVAARAGKSAPPSPPAPPKKPGLAKRAVQAVKKALSKKPAKSAAKAKPAPKAKTTANAKPSGANKKGVKPTAKAAAKKASGKPAKASKSAASPAKKSGKAAKGAAKAAAAKAASKKTAKKKR